MLCCVLHFQFLIDELAEWLDEAGVDACMQVVRDLRRELVTRISRAVMHWILGLFGNVHPAPPPQHYPHGHGVLNELGNE